MGMMLCDQHKLIWWLLSFKEGFHLSRKIVKIKIFSQPLKDISTFFYVDIFIYLFVKFEAKLFPNH